MIWLAFLRSNWKLLSIFAFVGSIVGWGLLMRAERNSARKEVAEIQADYDQFQAKVRVDGEAAKLKAERTIAEDMMKKVMTDAKNISAHAAVAVPVKRLRDSNPPRRDLPAAPSGSGRPDLACFDRAEYQRADGIAIEKLFAGARGLADEGTAATIDLDSARVWAARD